MPRFRMHDSASALALLYSMGVGLGLAMPLLIRPRSRAFNYEQMGYLFVRESWGYAPGRNFHGKALE